MTLTAGECRPLDEPLDEVSNRTNKTDLPEEIRNRTYAASVTLLSEQQLNVDVGGRNLTPFGFALLRSGDRLQFTIDGPAFFEEFPNFAYLQIDGAADETVANLNLSTFSIPFSGSFEYCVLNSAMNRRRNNCFNTPVSQKVTYSVCQSSNHRMTFTPNSSRIETITVAPDPRTLGPWNPKTWSVFWSRVVSWPILGRSCRVPLVLQAPQVESF